MPPTELQIYPPFVEYIEVGTANTATIYLVHSIFSYGENPPPIPEKIKYWVYLHSTTDISAQINYSSSPIQLQGLQNGHEYSILFQYDNSPLSSTYTFIPFSVTPASPIVISKETLISNGMLSNNGNTLFPYSSTLNITCKNAPLKDTLTSEMPTIPSQYTPTIQEYDACGNYGGAYSIEQTITILQKPAQPNITQILVNTPASGDATIYFSIENDGGVSLLQILVELNNGTEIINSIHDYSGANTIVLTGVLSNTEYSARISAINEIGQSEWSNWSTPFILYIAPTLTYVKYDITTKILAIFGDVFGGGGGGVGGNIDKLQFSINDGSYISLETVVLPQSYTIEPAYIPQYATIKIRTVKYGINSAGQQTQQYSPDSSAVPLYTNPSQPIVHLVEPSNNSIIIHIDPPTYDGGVPIVQYKYAVNNNVLFKSGGLTNKVVINNLYNGVRYQLYLLATNGYVASIPIDLGKHIPFGYPTPPFIEKALYLENNLSVYFKPRHAGGNGRRITTYMYKINDLPYTDISAQTQSIHVEYGLTYPATLKMKSRNAEGLVSTEETAIIMFQPDAPQIADVIAGEMCAFVYFTHSGNTGGNPIVHYRFSLNGQSLQIIFKKGATTSPLKIEGLENGRFYNIRICAYNGYILSPLSNTFSFSVGDIPNPLKIIAIMPFYGGVIVSCGDATENSNFGIPIDGYRWWLDGIGGAGNGQLDTSAGQIQIFCSEGRHTVSVQPYNSKGNGTISVEKQFNLYYYVANRPAIQSVVKSVIAGSNTKQWSITVRASSMGLNSFLPTIGFKYRFLDGGQQPQEYELVSGGIQMPLVIQNPSGIPIELVAFNLHGVSQSIIVR